MKKGTTLFPRHLSFRAANIAKFLESNGNTLIISLFLAENSNFIESKWLDFIISIL